MHRSNTYFGQKFFIGLIYDLDPWIPDEITLNLFTTVPD